MGSPTTGHYPDSLSILTSDQKKSDLVTLKALVPSIVELKEFLKISRQTLYRQNTAKIKESSRENLFNLVKIADLAFKFVQNDKEKAINWLRMPNQFFFNRAPIDWIVQGKGDIILNWLEERV